MHKVAIGLLIVFGVVALVTLQVKVRSGLRSITEARVHAQATTETYAELCPTILAEASPADSLAVFQKHEGCFEYVQSEAP